MSARRPSSYECPTSLCRGVRTHGKAVCDACWARLPEAHRGAILSANAARAPHRQATAAIAATNWLNANPVGAGIARVCGDVETLRESM